jgi:hypothetical protein
MLTKLRKKKIYLSRTLFFFNQQTIQTLKSKSNPNQAIQNAIATLLLLSHNKKIHTHTPSKHPNLEINPPLSYAQKSSASTLSQIA